jgi:hypothetical protein
MISQIDYSNQLNSYSILFLGVTGISVLRSLRDHRKAVAGRACIAWLGTNRIGEALAGRRRHDSPHGVLQRADRITHLYAIASPAGYGEGGHPVPQ